MLSVDAGSNSTTSTSSGAYGLMLDAARDDIKLARANRHDAGTQSHLQHPAMDEEQLVLVVVFMPHKLPFELGALDLLAVELAGNVRIPMGRNRGEHIG